MTLAQQVDLLWPGLTDDEARRVLWNCTCYPFGDLERVEQQMRDAYANSGGNIELAIEQAHEATDRAMAHIDELIAIGQGKAMA